MNKIGFSKRLVLNIYSFLTSVLSFIILPVIFVLRIVQKKDVSSWRVKSGKFELPCGFDTNKKTIMVHGVSVGEVVSLEKLIRRIKKTYPDCNLVLTTGTKTGQETAIKKMSDTVDFITYFPLDIPFAVKKFLDKINPDVVLTAETEIWPNFAYGCYLKKIPLFIINGRMSDESYRVYKILSPFFKCVLPLYSGIFTQSLIDKERLQKAGAPVNSLEVMKNLKFDVEKFDVNVDLKSGETKVLAAGSTHKGEDEIVLNVFEKLKKKNDIKLLLAPRHLTRTEAVENLIKERGFSYNLYSKKPSFDGVDIILLDVMGELAKLYYAADFAFIGGSFNKTGGHNPLEAVIFNKPVITGPSIKNFRDIYSILITEGAGFLVKTEEEFLKLSDKMLNDPCFYDETVKKTETVFNYQQGALDFVINKLEGVISK